MKVAFIDVNNVRGLESLSSGTLYEMIYMIDRRGDNNRYDRLFLPRPFIGSIMGPFLFVPAAVSMIRQCGDCSVSRKALSLDWPKMIRDA